jgi:esterase/lipase
MASIVPLGQKTQQFAHILRAMTTHVMNTMNLTVVIQSGVLQMIKQTVSRKIYMLIKRQRKESLSFLKVNLTLCFFTVINVVHVLL